MLRMGKSIEVEKAALWSPELEAQGNEVTEFPLGVIKMF